MQNGLLSALSNIEGLRYDLHSPNGGQNELPKASLPKGFNELLNLVLLEDSISRRVLHKQTNKIWLDFAYYILLSENRSDADARA